MREVRNKDDHSKVEVRKMVAGDSQSPTCGGTNLKAQHLGGRDRRVSMN